MFTIMKIVLIFMCAILHQSLTNGQMTQVSINSIDITMLPNPYMKSITTEIYGADRDTLTVRASIVETPPEGLIFKNYINFNNIDIPPMEKELCEMFDDKLFAPDVLAHGTPKDRFPKACPILPSNDYVILNYTFPSEKLPPGLPEGKIKSDILVYHRDYEDEVFITMNIVSELKNKVSLNSFTG